MKSKISYSITYIHVPMYVLSQVLHMYVRKKNSPFVFTENNLLLFCTEKVKEKNNK